MLEALKPYDLSVHRPRTPFRASYFAARRSGTKRAKPVPATRATGTRRGEHYVLAAGLYHLHPVTRISIPICGVDEDRR